MILQNIQNNIFQSSFESNKQNKSFNEKTRESDWLCTMKTSHVHHLIKSSRGILINLNDDCVLFTEDASTPKKLSIELPSKIPLLNHTAIVVLLTKTLVIIQTNCSPSQF